MKQTMVQLHGNRVAPRLRSGGRAQHNLGFIYRKGKGVPRNKAEAVKWYRKAAEQGFAQAQYNLGVMYYFGEGVSVNSIKAYMWWSLAMEQGNESATENLNIIKERNELPPKYP